MVKFKIENIENGIIVSYWEIRGPTTVDKKVYCKNTKELIDWFSEYVKLTFKEVD